jgi:Domain of unknown function (DUF4410)
LSILLAKFSLAATTVALIVAPALTTAAPASDKPVKKIDDGLLDKIELYVATLPAPADQTVVVRPFTSGKAELGTGNKEGDKEEQDESKQMQTEGPKYLADALIARLKDEGGFKGGSFATADAPAAADANTLIVEGEFTELDPGSRAKRYFVGFGAGKSAVAVKGTIKDGSGKLLATFSQRRVGTMGVAGGDSIKKMTGDCKSIGEDIAKFLSAWAKGKKLD